MRYAKPKTNYCVIAVNEYDEVIKDWDNENPTIEIDQLTDDLLEVWRERDSDGFVFVYCDRLEIGYWCNPTNLIFK